MVGERKDRRVHRRFIWRSFSQRWQDPHAAPAFTGFLKQNSIRSNDKRVIFGQSYCWRPHFLYWQTFRIFCAAEFFDGANPAFWLPRKTNQRAEIDKRRIVDAGGIPWKKNARVSPECFSTSRSIDRVAEIKQTRQNASNVGFDDRDWLIEGERRDSISSVTADARQSSYCRDTPRKVAAAPVLHGYRNRPQIAHPRVITEALPCVEDVTF